MTPSRGLRRLHALSVLTAGMTLLLLLAGALVVGHEAGLAVPDWPLSFGTWMPAMEGGVFYEHGHRMIAAVVGLLTTVLVIALWKAEPRRWVRGLGGIAWAAVVVQAILGGLTVLYQLPAPVVIAHAFTAQVFFCLALSLAVFTSSAWSEPRKPVPDPQFPAFRHLGAVATAVLLVQLLLGAGLRHQVLGVGPHLVGAGVAGLFLGWVCFRVITEWEAQSDLRRLAKFVGALLGIQVVLGLASYVFRTLAQPGSPPQSSVIWITTAHVVVGALLLGTTLILTLLAYRRTTAPDRVPSFAGDPQKTLA